MLILRKECQGALDALGFTEAHVEVNNRVLTIVGECGQSLVALDGISFYSNKVTKAEREYAVELFNKALAKYSKEFKALKKASDKVLALPKVPAGFDSTYNALEYRLKPKGLIKISTDDNEHISIININVADIDLEFIAGIVYKAGKYKKQMTLYAESKQEAAKYKAAIAKCSI